MGIKSMLNDLLFTNSKRWWPIRDKALSTHGLQQYYYKYRYKKINHCFGASIPLETRINGQPVFPHGLYGIFVSKGAVIGTNCVLFQQVTIGSNTLKGSKNVGAPRLGNNVYVGAGAKIIGNVVIGDNARIGANCVVTEDIPSNSTVVLGKNRIIVKDQVQNNSYIYWDDFG